MYVRMINKKAKWEQDKIKEVAKISADIVTNCLKNNQETLSLWYVDSHEEIDKAIIALSSNRDFINKLDYIIIKEEYIDKYGLVLSKNEGDSPYSEFNKCHFDIVNISYSALGSVAEMILDIINSGEKIYRVPQGVIKTKLKGALKDNVLNTQKISEGLLKEIEE